jgi:hypothetical protein
MLERKRAQEHGVYNGEDGNVRSDAESQRQQGGNGESGSFQEASKGVAQVSEGLFEPEDGALLTMELLGLFDAAVSATRLDARVIGTHAAALKLIFQQRQMRGDFAGQIAIGAAAVE